MATHSPLPKKDWKAALGSPGFSFRQKPAPQLLPTGIPQLDAEYGGLPRGAITEIAGPESSGRTTLLHSILAQATGRGEACALVDLANSFDPASAAAAGADLRLLMWVRCATHKQNALPAADLLVQNGGWGVIVLDLGGVSPREARHIPLNAWYRYRLAVENKPTVFLVIGQEPYAGSCSALILETRQLQARWTGTLFKGAVFQAARRKPPGHALTCFTAEPAECMSIGAAPRLSLGAVSGSRTATVKERANGTPGRFFQVPAPLLSRL